MSRLKIFQNAPKMKVEKKNRYRYTYFFFHTHTRHTHKKVVFFLRTRGEGILKMNTTLQLKRVQALRAFYSSSDIKASYSSINTYTCMHLDTSALKLCDAAGRIRLSVLPEECLGFSVSKESDLVIWVCQKLGVVKLYQCFRESSDEAGTGVEFDLETAVPISLNDIADTEEMLLVMAWVLVLARVSATAVCRGARPLLSALRSVRSLVTAAVRTLHGKSKEAQENVHALFPGLASALEEADEEDEEDEEDRWFNNVLYLRRKDVMTCSNPDALKACARILIKKLEQEKQCCDVLALKLFQAFSAKRNAVQV